MSEARIIINPNIQNRIDCRTGDVSDVEMFIYLGELRNFFANKMIEEAEEFMPGDIAAQDEYLQWLVDEHRIIFQRP